MKRIALALVAVAAVAGCKQDPATVAPKKNPDAVKLELFVMSQCPFGVQVVDAVREVVEKMGPDLDFSIDYIGTVAENGDLTSMHGPDEVTGDIIQLCAMKHAPGKYYDLLTCQNKNYREVAKNWEQCATEAKLPVEKIRTCMSGPEGKQLATESFKKAKERKATGSPTIFLAGKPYTGRRGTTDLFRAVCAAHTGATKPAACSAIPEPPAVNVKVLTDKRCTDCNPDRYINMLKFRIANPVITTVDYGDEAGKKLYEEAGATGNLPMVLFDNTIDADKEASSMFARHLKPAGSLRSLDIGAQWNPVCMNEGGCELPQCKGTMACREEVKGRLELFVMSQCPFGVRALNAMPEVLTNFGKNLDFQVHFIANGTAETGFTALHGQPEVEENIRELCAMKLYRKNYKFMDYILCRNKDIKSTNWEACATGGISAAAMKKCIETEGKKLHEEDIKIANALNIGSSPTWIVNGKYKFSGADAETIRRNICQHNPGMKGCENKLTGPEGGTPVTGGCGK